MRLWRRLKRLERVERLIIIFINCKITKLQDKVTKPQTRNMKRTEIEQMEKLERSNSLPVFVAD